MKNPLVSIIIPCFNSESFVKYAIESAINQTYNNIEIILVDNNSDDNTYEILKGIKSLYPEKIKVFQEYKKGAPAARNKGLKESRGEWIQFLDADDVLLPPKIGNQISTIKNSPCNLIIGDYLLYSTLLIRRKDANHSPWLGLITAKLGSTCSNLWARELVNEVGGWDEDQQSSQEYHLLFKILKQNPQIIYCRKRGTRIYQRTESISKTHNPDRLLQIFEDNFKLRNEIKSYLIKTGLYNKEYEKAHELHVLKLYYWSKFKCKSFFQTYMSTYNFKLPFYLKAGIFITEVLRRYLLLALTFVKQLKKKMN